MAGRTPTSPHGRLFGGDTLYEVVAELSRSREATYAVPLAAQLGRTVKQTRDELAKLAELGIVAEVGKDGKAHLLAPTSSPLSEAVMELPQLLIAQLGQYKRPRPARAR